jgi:hypothetical protein
MDGRLALCIIVFLCFCQTAKAEWLLTEKNDAMTDLADPTLASLSTDKSVMLILICTPTGDASLAMVSQSKKTFIPQRFFYRVDHGPVAKVAADADEEMLTVKEPLPVLARMKSGSQLTVRYEDNDRYYDVYYELAGVGPKIGKVLAACAVQRKVMADRARLHHPNP